MATCTRCGDGSGTIARYSHVQGGRCFACGRVPSAPTARTQLSTRERSIATLSGRLAAARREAAEGYGEQWLATVRSSDACPRLDGVLAEAPADVRARAVAALRDLGLHVEAA